MMLPVEIAERRSGRDNVGSVAEEQEEGV